MNKRPPLLGYNHNVRHAGRLFHVQSEDSGLSRLVVTTHVFFEGTILATLRSTYTPDMADPAVQKQMQDQHKAMLKRVRDGEFDKAPEVQAHSAVPRPTPSSDDASGVWAASGPGGPMTGAALRDGASKDGLDAASSTLRMAVPKPGSAVTSTSPGAGRLTGAGAIAVKGPDPAAPQPVSERPGAEPLRQTGSGIGAKAAEPVKAAEPAKTAEPAKGAPGKTAPPPVAERPTGELAKPGGLAARLKLSPATATPSAVSAPPASRPPPSVASVQPKAAEPDDEPVLEFEAELPDDEPSIDIEPPHPADRTDRIEDALLSQSTPLPVARPLASLRDNSVPGVPNTLFASNPPPGGPAPSKPALPRSLSRTGAGGNVSRPLLNRPLHTGIMRVRPTAEGVTLLRGASASTRPSRVSADGSRVTLALIYPTAPSPQSSALPLTPPPGIVPLEDERSLDWTVLSYLSRELRK